MDTRTGAKPTPDKLEYVLAIRLFITAKRVDDILEPAEIGALAGFDRLKAQRDSLIFNLSRLYAESPRMDAAPGILVLTTFGADNRDGIARFSHGKLGRILHRTRPRISEAADRLAKKNLIQTVSRQGQAFAAAPIIPKVLLGSGNLIWLTDALSGKTCSDERTCSGERTCSDERTSPVPTREHVEGKPVPTREHNLTNRSLTHSESARAKNSASKKRAARKPEKSRLPEDWTLPPEWRAYARDKGLTDPQIDAIAEDFQAYWLSGNATGGGLKADWPATWQSWVRRLVNDGRVPKHPRAALNGAHPKRPAGMSDAAWEIHLGELAEAGS